MVNNYLESGYILKLDGEDTSVVKTPVRKEVSVECWYGSEKLSAITEVPAGLHLFRPFLDASGGLDVVWIRVA